MSATLVSSKSLAVVVGTSGVLDSREVYQASPLDRIEMIGRGVAASDVVALARSLNRSTGQLIAMLDVAPSTFQRKLKEHKSLTSSEAERVIGFSKLVGQVEMMVEEAGNPQGFEASKWLADWLDAPNPALGGRCPGEFLSTSEGLGIVSGMLSQMYSGAYA